MGTGPGIGSVGTGNGGCSGGTGTSGGMLGVCGPIVVLILVLPTSPGWKEKADIDCGFVGQAVLEGMPGIETRSILSNAFIGYSMFG